MTISSDNQERCVVIRDPKDLNREGCRFFIEADNASQTMISSSLLRWLTHENDGNTFYTEEQSEAVKIIEAAQKRGDMAPPFMMKILLYADPRKLKDTDSRYIKALLECVGVEVRYLKADEGQNLRIALKGNKLYLSMSGNKVVEVHEGLLYEASSENSPLLNYFKTMFCRDFDKAKRLKLVNNRIVFADSALKRFFRWCKTENGLVAVISGLIGALLSIVIEIMF